MAESDSDKTEEATPERRRKAREEGQFPRARDTGAVAATVGIVLTISALGGDYWNLLKAFSERCFSEGLAYRGGGIGFLVRELLHVLVVGTVPLAMVAAVCGILAGFAEAGFHPNLDLVAPKFERLDPVGKLGQMFSPKSALTSTALSLLRVGVVAWVTYSILKGEFGLLSRLTRTPVFSAAREVYAVWLRLALWSTVALALLAAVDYVTAWFRHEAQLRMTPQEIKDEMKQQEGSPQIRARQRARARELLRRGVRKAVKEASVIVTNPTHIAIVLRYKASEGAPVVTGKGYDDVAKHIRELARDYDIPIVENKPLARALAEKVKVGRVIPVDYYVAVAEILAFVFRAKRRGVKA
ncbi:MAG TPA: EscU/YscU/HrcU family type III secretion system export apparatus switch protein [Polyangiaceae bacterium]|nr:EscU/YscU/HrcU family type III secretion system export apparatus switch protein [Polyangiaceae bacterium]